MNVEVITKRVKGKGVVYTNKCPKSNNRFELYAGNPKYCNPVCPFFVKRFEKDGKVLIHCNHSKI